MLKHEDKGSRVHAAGLALGLGAGLPARLIGAGAAASGGVTAAAGLSLPASEQGLLDLESRSSVHSDAAGSDHITIVLAQVCGHLFSASGARSNRLVGV